MLLDANLLLYAIDEDSPLHEPAAQWLEQALNGVRRVAFPWPTLLAFLRITTHSRALVHPLDARRAWMYVDEWLANDNAWIPTPTARHAEVFSDLMIRYDLRGHLVPDGHLAALAVEHGLTVCSSDTDFARFHEIRWVNPLSPRS